MHPRETVSEGQVLTIEVNCRLRPAASTMLMKRLAKRVRRTGSGLSWARSADDMAAGESRRGGAEVVKDALFGTTEADSSWSSGCDGLRGCQVDEWGCDGDERARA